MKIQLGSLPYIYPVPIVLVGANVTNQANFETIGDVGLMGIKPPIVYISSGVDHFTNQGILENGTFSINFPSTGMLALVDYCGQVSGKEVDKGALFEVFYGELGNAPLIQECPVNLECRVIKEFSIQHRQIFVGQVICTHVTENYVSKQEDRVTIANLSQLDPILYALDNNYYRIGSSIGIGYQEAKKFIKNGP
jgi:flavin reductase (DIM6/NTAB) family NADH-FMN oxidoreductase RutF